MLIAWGKMQRLKASFFTLFLSFIEKYGTHIITSLQVGGKDVIYVKQLQNSPCSNVEVLKRMETMAERRFTGQSGGYSTPRERPGKDKVWAGLPQMKDIILSIFWCHNTLPTIYSLNRGLLICEFR